MSHESPRKRVLSARKELDCAEQLLVARWQPWRARIARHRLGLLIGGGLLGGLALATVPPKGWSRVGALLFGGGASLLRSPFGLPVLGGLWTALLNTSSTHAGGAEPKGTEEPSLGP